MRVIIFLYLSRKKHETTEKKGKAESKKMTIVLAEQAEFFFA